jgi:hypothetical protein
VLDYFLAEIAGIATRLSHNHLKTPKQTSNTESNPTTLTPPTIIMPVKTSGSDHSLVSLNSAVTSSSDKGNLRLEALADTLQEQLRSANLIQDRKKAGKKISPNCFLGCDAVTVLMNILQTERLELYDESDEALSQPDGPVTREEALTVGREIALAYRFFVHADAKNGKKDLMLQDTDTDFYVFHNNLPMEVYKMKKQHPSAWDRVKVLEEHVVVKVCKGPVRIHIGCFIASEAVDVLMKLKLVRSRGEGAHAMQKMNEKVRFFKVVSHHEMTEFKDDKTMFLQFTAKDSQVKELLKERGRRVSHGLSQGSNHPSSGSMVRSNHSCSSSGSVTKDNRYFKLRAKDIRDRLAVSLQQRRSYNNLSSARANEVREGLGQSLHEKKSTIDCS